MKKITLITLSLFGLIHSFAQTLDSIKYAYGYLYYHEYGKGEPVILLSGGPGVSCNQEQEVAIELGKNYRAILLEQTGTGISIPAPFDSTTISLEAALADLNLLLDHLHLKEAIFYGHSWGGTLAMSFATSFPKRVKALILTDTGPFKMDDAGRTQNFNINARLGKYERQFMDSINMKERNGTMTEAEFIERRKLGFRARFSNEDILDSVYPRYAVGIMNKKMAGLMWQDLWNVHFDLTNKFGAYHNPFYAIAGRQDPAEFVTYEVKIAVPRAELFWIQNCGHFPMFDEPVEFYKILNPLVEKEKKHP